MTSTDSERSFEEVDVDELNLGEPPNCSQIPSLFISPPPIIDDLATDTIRKREDTIKVCLPYLSGNHKELSRTLGALPELKREKHVAFLRATLQNARFTAYDASRPWVVYWSLTGLTLLGEDVEIYSEK